MGHSTSTQRSGPALERSHNIPTLAVFLIEIADLITIWAHRARTRGALKELPLHRLDDIGITQAQARSEAEKPFWVQ